MLDDLYYKIYVAAHNNAVDLLLESLSLFKSKSYGRSYALAYTALEEISKSQFAADVYTGLHTDQEFRDFYRNHKQKLDRVQWVHGDANKWPYNIRWVGPDPDDVERINPEQPLFSRRQGAMYVDVNFKQKTVISPKETISEKNAEDIILLVETAFKRIIQVEEDQGRIGTKGFMK